MKILFLTAIKEWIINKNKFGFKYWKDVADEMGMGVEKFSNQDNFSSVERMNNMYKVISEKLNIAEDDFKQRFLEFWMTDFAPRLYQSYAKQTKNAKELIKNIIKVNNEFYNILPDNIYVQKIDVSETDENTLIIKFSSEKSLIDIIGILRSVSSYYNETFNIKKLDSNEVEIKFGK